MRIVETRDREALERFLRRDAHAQVYALADLDEPFWSDVRCFAGLDSAGAIAAVCLLLEPTDLPIVYAAASADAAAAPALVRALAPELPAEFFGNLPLGVARSFEATHAVEPHGEHAKMALLAPVELAGFEHAAACRLGPADCAELCAFYEADAYLPEERGGRFFARYMLELGPWFGIREAGRLVSVAGLHVLSQRYGVAALGNIATRPDRRGRGLARALTARLCRELGARIPTIGLNVAASNTAARRCYEALGFREVLRYEEAVLRRRPQ